MYKKILNRIKTIKPSRQIIYIVAVVLLYFLFIETISKIIDQRLIERQIKEWFEQTVDYSTFADIDHTDTALRTNWRTDLYIHEFTVASPNPEFTLPLLNIDTIRASSNFYSLFGGMQANPNIQLRDGILNIKKNHSNVFNTADLNLQKIISNPKFLPYINIHSLNFLLMHCKIILDFPNLHTEIPLNGRLIAKDNLLILRSLSPNTTFTLNDNGYTKELLSTIVIKNCSIDRNSKEIVSCDLAVENIPAIILNSFFPTLPEIPTKLNLSGKLQAIGNSLVFTGVLENLLEPKLPRFLNITISTNKSFLTAMRFFHLEISENNSPILSIKSQKDTADNWEPLKLYFTNLDIDTLLSGKRYPWLNFLVSNFPATNIEASSANLANFDIGEAVVDVVTDSNGKTDISLEGSIASGKLSLLAKEVSLKGSNLPKMVMATLEIKDTASSLLTFSKNLPKILDCTPTTGNGEIALLYKRSETDNTTETFKMQIKLHNVVIPTLSSGAAIQSLAEIPGGLNKLSRLCAESNLKNVEPPVKLIPKLPNITFENLAVNYEVNSDADIIFSTIDAHSRELGKISGKISKLSSKALQMVLIIDEIPQQTLEQAAISAEALQAIKALQKIKSFKISFYESNQNTTTQNDYIEDGYRYWLENLLPTTAVKIKK